MQMILSDVYIALCTPMAIVVGRLQCNSHLETRCNSILLSLDLCMSLLLCYRKAHQTFSVRF